jgi:ATP-dependent helicase HrpB
MARPPLPVDEKIPNILTHLHRVRALVLVAPPGSGKTLRVAPALASEGPVLLLQPRRVAARSIARRMAWEQDWTLGEEVGWQVRFEHRFGLRTRVLVATEGILTARLQADPLLSGFKTILLDEFHERTLHADLALGLSRQAWLARDDLQLVVMSATLDAAPVADFLGGCPVLEISGQPHPVKIEYWPGVQPAQAIQRALPGLNGHLLCFLPGAREIARTQSELLKTSLPGDVQLYPFHGALRAEAQDQVLAPSSTRKIILATNLAETSITIDGVRVVVDSGTHKILKYDLERGVDRLELERIPQDSARQRAGRAGRTSPGRACRLWDQAFLLAPHRIPEIHRVDLSAPALELLAWGADPRHFEWFESPQAERLEAALDLLEKLGARSGNKITPLGQMLCRFPLSPRLAKVLVEAGGSPLAAACCALLSERPLPLHMDQLTTSDVLSQADRLPTCPEPIQEATRHIAALARKVLGTSFLPRDEERLLYALFTGFPDRVAQRRGLHSDRFLLASGHGARQARESGVQEGEFVVALDLAGGESEALIRQASLVRREWLTPTEIQTIHTFDSDSKLVKASECRKYQALELSRRPVPPDPEKAFPLLMEFWEKQDWNESSRLWLRRAEKAGFPVDRKELGRKICQGQIGLPEWQLRDWLSPDSLEALRRLCPENITIPSGRKVRLEYCEDGTVRLKAKLQELFGLANTPRVGKKNEAVIVELLAPNGHPVQTTTDLKSFWENTYPQVRKDLRGRYPRHPWPEDPWNAPASSRAKSKSR